MAAAAAGCGEAMVQLRLGQLLLLMPGWQLLTVSIGCPCLPNPYSNHS
jgi:hypothetical protein